MTTFEDLTSNPQIDNLTFWTNFREAVIDAGSGLDQHNATIRALVTEDRCADTSRIEAMTDNELDWMVQRTRRGKPVRVYRAAKRGHLTGFRFHTNVAHALDDIEGQDGELLLLVGVVDPASIMLRIERDGRKLVIAFPEKVQALKVDQLTKLAEEAA